MSKLARTQIEDAVKEAIQRMYQQPTDITVSEIGFDMPEGMAVYATFTVPDENAGPGEDTTQEEFSYGLIQPDGTCRLLGDGEELVRFFQNLLDRKRSLWQRFSELNFNDLIGAFIAFAIVGSFSILVINAALTKAPPEKWISKEFLAIVSMVLGFYFGRNPKSKD